jgi:hypothetical protein
MKFIDLIYYISVQAFVRGNKTRFGSFIVVSFWFSLLQATWLNIIGLLLTLVFERDFGIGPNMHFTPIAIVFFFANNIYLQIGNRKDRILNQFPLNEGTQKRYWYFVIALFFISIIAMLLLLDLARR